MKIYQTLARRKPLQDTEPPKLAKVLTTFDLTALGIGSTLGVGVYVLAGEVSKTTAGPSIIFSFLIAAVASVFAGLCYAEFGARVPKAGSAYIYSYVTIGEFIAFFIGWNLILEYAIGSASVVKGLSTYVDSLIGYRMREFLLENVPMNVPSLSEYPDIFAFTVTLLFSFALAFGAKESSLINNLFTLTNVTVVIYVIICGSFRASPSNWQIAAEDVPEGYGNGGFAPYGLTGIIKGAAICFYGFIGFDVIATAGEEAKDPKKSIPFSIIVSLGVIFMAYFGISTVLTMMLPYYEQDQDAPLPYVFHYFGWTLAEYIVLFGAIFGLGASLMGAMFPLPRIIYAMSNDGLLFKTLSTIHPRFQTPLTGTLLAGLLTGCLAAIFNLSQLVNMMSIGTLMAYSVVAACVLMLRYEVSDENERLRLPMPISRHWRGYLWNSDGTLRPTKLTSTIVTWEVALYCFICYLFSLTVSSLSDMLFEGNWIAYALIVACTLPVIGILVLIKRQPISDAKLSFSVPLVPWLPGLSILINIYLMTQLDVMTWIRFLVWLIIGFSIYFSYGIKHSVQKARIEQVRFERSVKEHDSSELYTTSKDILVLTGQ